MKNKLYSPAEKKRLNIVAGAVPMSVHACQSTQGLRSAVVNLSEYVTMLASVFKSIHEVAETRWHPGLGLLSYK